jgi:[calcium/calmodulin-dependent protein kinase] kinase
MQVIPVADFEVPLTMGREQLSTDSPEGREAVDLLRRLLEKKPSNRISLEQAKVSEQNQRNQCVGPA